MLHACDFLRVVVRSHVVVVRCNEHPVSVEELDACRGIARTCGKDEAEQDEALAEALDGLALQRSAFQEPRQGLPRPRLQACHHGRVFFHGMYTVGGGCAVFSTAVVSTILTNYLPLFQNQNIQISML